MSSQEASAAKPSGDFLAFDSNPNQTDGNNRHFRQFHGTNKQYHPYNKNRNRNFNYRRDQHFNSGSNDNAQFAPPNFSSPIGNDHQQQRFDGGYRNRQNFPQNFNNRNRNFTPHKRMNQGNHQRNEVPIQQYFHQSMLEDPWTDCHRFSSIGSSAVQANNVPDEVTEPIVDNEIDKEDDDNSNDEQATEN